MPDPAAQPLPPLSGRPLAEALRLASHHLAAASATPGLDARLLLQHVLSMDHAALILAERRILSAVEAQRYTALLARRAIGEPVSRILGWREFYGRPFRITPHVLDPRPDTETLIDAALPLAHELLRRHGAPLKIADIGTGSGIILTTLLAELPDAIGIATDVSEAALLAARANAGAHGVAERALFARTSWLDGIGGPVHLLLSNPPYITSEEMQELPPEVRHDPPQALHGGTDGLEAYRALAERAAKVLLPGGWLLVEIGHTQASPVRAMFESAGLAPCPSLSEPLLRDLAGHARVIALRRR